jgi:hypothetical protein
MEKKLFRPKKAVAFHNAFIDFRKPTAGLQPDRIETRKPTAPLLLIFIKSAHFVAIGRAPCMARRPIDLNYALA